ncbi:hypothetical protein VQH23_26550 (plasmid) [Pararoseomonas sp. SCSIO 73927]|uniref:hypothetical protein n=1 Tax=Pararoseomonas sp. SCSIO 73927 TaxID=3114537 RepID=UPI0030CD45FC
MNDPTTAPTPAPFLGRAALADAMTSRGLFMTKGTLDYLAKRGDGPPFSRWGRRCVYDLDAAMRWAEARLQPVQRAA